jgi:hypothetical protein
MASCSIRRIGRIRLFACVADGLYPAGWIGGGAEPPETGERR